MENVFEKRRKRIALLVGHAEEPHQKSFIEGLSEEAFQYDWDVCVFAMYNKCQPTKAREIGESNIFSLINYELFDGFVLLLETIHTTGMAKVIEKNVKEHFDGPVVCVDWDSSYFINAKIKSYDAVKRLIAHLIEEHGYQDIAFLTGRKGHPHSTERLQAYMDAMEEHGISIRNNRIFYGDFWYGSGKRMVERLLKNPKDMPRAIACANDYMAIDVAENLKEAGYNVPADVAVIGYDSVEQGQIYTTPITSVPLPSKECGIYAAKAICAMLQGEEVPPFEEEKSLYIGSSCGCNQGEKVSTTHHVRRTNLNLQDDFYSRYNQMMTDLLSKTDFKSFIDTVLKYVHHLGEFENFTLCLNSYWRDLSKLNETDGLKEAYTEEVLPILQYGNSITGNPINYNVSFKSDTLFPELHESKCEPNIYFFTPLFFEERSFGYAVISYGKERKCYDEVYWLWLRNVMHGLEGFRRMNVSTNTQRKSIQIQAGAQIESFGQRLTKLRMDKKISQEELADLLDVSRQSISKWENDKVYPELSRLLMMSEYFDISLDYLMRGFEKN